MITGGGGGGVVPSTVVTAAADPTAVGQVPLSTGTTSNATAWATAASAGSTTPNPDTSGGSAGSAATFARGDHSHPQSSLYQAAGQDVLNTVSASGSALTIPAGSAYQSNFVKLTAASVAITMPTAVAGARLRVAFQQDSTGSRVPAFPANVGWISGTAPTWSTAGGKVDLIDFECFDGTNWLGWPVAIGLVIPLPAVTVLQTASVHNASSVTFASNITAGSAIVLLLQTSTLPTISGGGVTFGLIADINNANLSGGWYTSAYCGPDSTGGVGTSTINIGQTCNVVAFEVAGIALSSPVDTSITNTGQVASGNAFTTSSVTASQGGEFVCIVANGSNTVTNPGTPWTTGTDPGNILHYAYQTNTVASTGYQATFGLNNSQYYNAVSFILKP